MRFIRFTGSNQGGPGQMSLLVFDQFAIVQGAAQRHQAALHGISRGRAEEKFERQED